MLRKLLNLLRRRREPIVYPELIRREDAVQDSTTRGQVSTQQDDIIQMQKKALISLKAENERVYTYRRLIAAQLHIHRVFVRTILPCTDVFIQDELVILKEALDKCPKESI